jgi:predicted phage terminase large subunit-like protein
VYRARLDYPSLKHAVRERQKADQADVVLIEDKGAGTSLIQELKAEGLQAVTPYYPAAHKTIRLHAQTDIIEAGYVHVRKGAPWLPEFMAELTAFPACKHDDQVDSMSQFLDWKRRCYDAWDLSRLWSPPARPNSGWNCAGSGFIEGLLPPPTGIRFRAPRGSDYIVLLNNEGTIYWADPKTKIIVVRPEHAAQVEARGGWERLD